MIASVWAIFFNLPVPCGPVLEIASHLKRLEKLKCESTKIHISGKKNIENPSAWETKLAS